MAKKVEITSKNIFKSTNEEVLKKEYNLIWIRLINILQRSQ